MARPFMQYGVRKLEDLFAKGKADLETLKQLQNELQHRQVPRAVALLAEVQASMHVRADAPQVPTVPPQPPDRPTSLVPRRQQPDLWERHARAPDDAPPPEARSDAPAVRPPEPPPVVKAPPATTPTMPLEDAYKVLKATSGATWESIEQTRRALVQQAHPSRWKTQSAEKRAQALADAKLVNAAYAALSQARCGGR